MMDKEIKLQHTNVKNVSSILERKIDTENSCAIFYFIQRRSKGFIKKEYAADLQLSNSLHQAHSHQSNMIREKYKKKFENQIELIGRVKRNTNYYGIIALYF